MPAKPKEFDQLTTDYDTVAAVVAGLLTHTAELSSLLTKAGPNPAFRASLAMHMNMAKLSAESVVRNINLATAALEAKT